MSNTMGDKLFLLASAASRAPVIASFAAQAYETATCSFRHWGLVQNGAGRFWLSPDLANFLLGTWETKWCRAIAGCLLKLVITAQRFPFKKAPFLRMGAGIS